MKQDFQDGNNLYPVLIKDIAKDSNNDATPTSVYVPDPDEVDLQSIDIEVTHFKSLKEEWFDTYQVLSSFTLTFGNLNKAMPL